MMLERETIKAACFEMTLTELVLKYRKENMKVIGIERIL